MSSSTDLETNNGLPSLPGTDDIDIIVDGAKQKAWILHRKPLPLQDELAGVGFDTNTNQFTLTGLDGTRILLETITVVEPLRKPLRAVSEISLVEASDTGEVKSVRILPLEFTE